MPILTFTVAVKEMLVKLNFLAATYPDNNDPKRYLLFLCIVDTYLRPLKLDFAEFKQNLEKAQFPSASILLQVLVELFGEDTNPAAYLDSSKPAYLHRPLIISQIFNAAKYQNATWCHYYVALCLSHGIWVPKDQDSADYFLGCAVLAGYPEALALASNLARKGEFYFSLARDLFTKQNPRGVAFLAKAGQSQHLEAKFILRYMGSQAGKETWDEKIQLRLKKYFEIRNLYQTGNTKNLKRNLYELALAFLPPTIDPSISADYVDLQLAISLLRFSLFGKEAYNVRDAKITLETALNKIALYYKDSPRYCQKLATLHKLMAKGASSILIKVLTTSVLRLLCDAISQGDKLAKYLLGECFLDGIIVERSHEIAFKLIEEAGLLDSPQFSCNAPLLKSLVSVIISRYYLLNKDYTKAYAWLAPYENRYECPETQFWLGVCYLHGLGIEQNIHTALEHFYNSAFGGVNQAYHYLIAFYLASKNVGKNAASKVRTLTEFAAAQEDAIAAKWLKATPLTLDNVSGIIAKTKEKEWIYLEALLHKFQSSGSVDGDVDPSHVLIKEPQKLDVMGLYMLGFQAFSPSILDYAAHQDDGAKLESAFTEFFKNNPRTSKEQLAEIMLQLADKYLQGQGKSESFCINLAQQWLALAGWAGHNEALDMLHLCRFDNGHLQEFIPIWQIIRASTSKIPQEKISAQLNLGKLFLVNRKLTKNDVTKSIEYLQSVIMLGTTSPQLADYCLIANKFLVGFEQCFNFETKLTSSQLSSKEKITAAAKLKQAYLNGYIISLQPLGIFYLKENIASELEWLRNELERLAAEDVCFAKLELAIYYILYLNPKCEIDNRSALVSKAMILVEEAAVGNEYQSRLYLAILYFFGYGLPRDIQRAKQLINFPTGLTEKLDDLRTMIMSALFSDDKPRPCAVVRWILEKSAKTGTIDFSLILQMIDQISAIERESWCKHVEIEKLDNLDIKEVYRRGFEVLSIPILKYASAKDNGEGAEAACKEFFGSTPESKRHRYLDLIKGLVSDYLEDGQEGGKEQTQLSILMAQQWLIPLVNAGCFEAGVIASCCLENVYRGDINKIWRLLLDSQGDSLVARARANLELAKLFSVDRISLFGNPDLADGLLKQAIVQSNKVEELTEIYAAATKLSIARSITQSVKRKLLVTACNVKEQETLLRQLKQGYLHGDIWALHCIAMFYISKTAGGKVAWLGPEESEQELIWLEGELSLQSSQGVCFAKILLVRYYIFLRAPACANLTKAMGIVKQATILLADLAGIDVPGYCVYSAILNFFGCGMPRNVAQAREFLDKALRAGSSQAEYLDKVLFAGDKPKTLQEVLADPLRAKSYTWHIFLHFIERTLPIADTSPDAINDEPSKSLRDNVVAPGIPAEKSSVSSGHELSGNIGQEHQHDNLIAPRPFSGLAEFSIFSSSSVSPPPTSDDVFAPLYN